MKRTTRPLLGGRLLAGCLDRELPTAVAPEGAALAAFPVGCHASAEARVAALIQAIAVANANPGADVITRAAGCTNTLTSVDNGVSQQANGLPVITGELTIHGNGARIERSAAEGTPHFRILEIAVGASVSISDLTISNGYSRQGGIWNNGALTLTNSTVSGNNLEPGARLSGGGGIRNSESGALTLTHSTISGNSAPTGGGIYRFSGTVTLRNTIVVNSPTGGNCASTITDGGYNLDSGTTCGFTATGSRSDTDPLLGPLQVHAPGTTATHALLPGSLAIDAIPAGRTAAAPTSPRTSAASAARRAAAANIGAFELVQQAPPSPVGPVLAFFDAVVSGGTRVGSGSGASAQNRRNALRNMLVAASDLLRAGDLAGGCGQLEQAQRRTDGDPQPPDFAAGPSASALAAQIQALRGTLGCP